MGHLESGGANWHFAVEGRQAGPVGFEQLHRMAQSGSLRSSDLVWRVGTPQWVSAGSIPGLFGSGGRPVASSATEVASPQSGTVHGLLVWILICWVPSIAIALLSQKFPEHAAVLTVLNWGAVLGSGVWAGIDSSKLGFRRYRSFVAQRPIAVGIVVALFWVVAFPWYLSDRERLKARQLPAASDAGSTTGWVVARVVAAIGLFAAYVIIVGALFVALGFVRV
jgi:hypothetical protein